MSEYENKRLGMMKDEFVNWLLDERKAVKLRLAELESELEELGVKFYENNAFEAIFCEKDLTRLINLVYFNLMSD